MPTPLAFDFDAQSLSSYDPETVERLLAEQPALYINHLRMARCIRGWADRMGESPSGNEEFNRGYAKALREVAAHLRQGDYVEGGIMMTDQFDGGA